MKTNNDQRMVDVELLEEARRHLELHASEYGHPGQPATIAKLHTIIDGPGVEPVAQWDESRGVADRVGVSKIPDGAELYLAAPSAPVQAMFNGWQLVPKGPTREMVDAAQNVCPLPPRFAGMWDAMLAAAPQPPIDETSAVAKQHDALTRDSARWDAIETLMWLGTVTMEHRQDGDYGILLEPAESIKPQEWTGDDPGAAVDAVVATLAQPPKEIGE